MSSIHTNTERHSLRLVCRQMWNWIHHGTNFNSLLSLKGLQLHPPNPLTCYLHPPSLKVSPGCHLGYLVAIKVIEPAHKRGQWLAPMRHFLHACPKRSQFFYTFLELPPVGTGSRVKKKEARRVGWIEQTLMCKICKRNYIRVDDIMIRHNICITASNTRL